MHLISDIVFTFCADYIGPTVVCAIPAVHDAIKMTIGRGPIERTDVVDSGGNLLTLGGKLLAGLARIEAPHAGANS